VADACLAASVLEARPRSLDTRVDPRFVVLRLPGEATEAGPEIATMMERVADALRACGACVEEIASPAALAPLDAAHRTIMSCEVARSFAGLSRSDGDRLSRPLRDFIDRGRRESDHALSRAHAEASEAHRALWPVVAGGAVLICPAAPGEAPVGLGSTGNALFNRPWSLLRYAALTIPSGRGPNGLPLGLQFVDPSPWADRLFPAAAFAERALKPLLAET
jgi:amidase